MKITKKNYTKPWTDKVNTGIETFDFFLLTGTDDGFKGHGICGAVSENCKDNGWSSM